MYQIINQVYLRQQEKSDILESILRSIQQRGGYITTEELDSRVQYERLREANRLGVVLRLKNGVYVEANALANNMIDVERIVPSGVVCLYNAFFYYQLSMQVPSSTCVAIEAKRKVSVPSYPIIDFYYWKKEYLEFGITQQKISGYSVRITDVERTVCDAIKYRNKIGMDVCGEVLNSYLQRPSRNISLLTEYAKRLRINNILMRYIETRI